MGRDYKTCAVTKMRYRVANQSNWWKAVPTPVEASLEISMRNERCTGDGLRCQVEWAKERFERIVFSVGDTLLRHNLSTIAVGDQPPMDLDQAIRECRRLGDEWLESNARTIDAAASRHDVTVVRWDEWLQHPEFPRWEKALAGLFGESQRFADAIRHEIRRYGSRRGIALSADQSERLCYYLVEELAVYGIQSESRDTVNIYPGGMMSLYRVLPEIEGVPTALAYRDFVFLDLERPKVTS